jgi:FkbH-like protein
MKHDPENLDPAISQKLNATTDCYRVRYLVENGYILVARQKFEEIVYKRYQVENLGTSLAETAIVLLEAYDKNQQYKETLDFFKKHEDLLKDHPIALTITGAASKNLNDPQQAEIFLTRAIQSDISYPDPHLLLGDLYCESKPKLAVNHYSQYNEYHSSILGARVFVKRIKSLLNEKESPILFKDLPIAFIGNFTIEPIRVALEVECFKQSINPRFYFGGYDQYVQEISNSDSFLYQFNPVVTFFFLDHKTLLPELFNNFFELSSEKRLLLAEEKIKLVRTLCNEFIDRSKSHLVISNFLFLEECYMGVYDSKLVNGQREILEKMNSKLLNHTRENIRRFHFLDTEKVLSNCGKTRCSNEKMRYLAKMVIPDQALPYLARELMRFIRPIMGQTKKCLVLDLDNTLWGGVLGEEGLEGIKLDYDNPPGNAFWEFQKTIKTLQKRGIILAINSKNDFDLVKNAFQNHPYMELKLSDFACIRANWQDKAQNMREIAKELNLGLSSFVYFDDNPAERFLIKRELPEVLTIDVPEDCSEFTRCLLNLDVFETLHITDEDKNRTKLYQAEGERKQLKTKVTDLNSYLKALDIKVEISFANKFAIPRIAQLTQRTNQFNLTTKRYSESDICSFSNSKSNLVYYIKSGDRFGDHGIVGSCIISVKNDLWEIDTFLLSCRVVGRGIEQAFLYYICQNAINKKIKQITGRYFPTQKNKISEAFYLNMGFKIISNTPQEKAFSLSLPSNILSLPTHINKVNHGN